DGIRDRNVTGVQTCALPIFGGDKQIDGLRLDDIDGRARQAARYRELVHADRQLLRPHEGDVGRAAQDDRAGHRLLAELLVLNVRSEERRVGKECGCGWTAAE